jgi:hypothetical protein
MGKLPLCLTRHYALALVGDANQVLAAASSDFKYTRRTRIRLYTHSSINILSSWCLPRLGAMTTTFMMEFGIAVMHQTCSCGRRHSTRANRCFYFVSRRNT